MSELNREPERLNIEPTVFYHLLFDPHKLLTTVVLLVVVKTDGLHTKGMWSSVSKSTSDFEFRQFPTAPTPSFINLVNVRLGASRLVSPIVG
jgi:hypothetical protein